MSKTTKKLIFIADIETEGFKENEEKNYLLQPLFMCAQNYDTKEFLPVLFFNDITKVDEFFEQFSAVRQPAVFYFHNLDFDLKFVFNSLPKGYEKKIVASGSRTLQIAILKRYKNGCKTLIELRDTYAILQSSVEDIGHSMGFEKMKIDYPDLQQWKNYTKEQKQQYIEYCVRDVEIVSKALKELLDFTNKQFNLNLTMNFMNLTLPSLAKKVWLHIMRKHFPNPTFLLRGLPDFLETMLRKYYFGGRVEVFNFNVCLQGAYNDYNSFYPFVMHKYDYPLPPYRHTKNLKEMGWLELRKNKNVCGAFCVLDERNSEIPFVPIKVNNKVFFPTGHKSCFLFREELDYLIYNLNQPVEIQYWLECSGWYPIFEEFINKTYFKRQQLKNEGRGASYESHLYKIFMNSLYGKFAEKIEKDDMRIFDDLLDSKCYELLSEFENVLCEDCGRSSYYVEYREKSQDYAVICKKCGYKVVVEEKKYWNIEPLDFAGRMIFVYRGTKETRSQTNIVFSMRVTALARLHLHKDLVKAQQNDALWYCDTDSIVTNSILEDSTELGHLKPELLFTRFFPLGCKEYSFEVSKEMEERILKKNPKFKFSKMKGFTQDSKSLLEFTKLYLMRHKVMEIAKLKKTLRRGLHPYEVIITYKEKQSFYDKRWIQSDLSTKPIDVSDDLNDVAKHNYELIKRLIDEFKEFEQKRQDTYGRFDSSEETNQQFVFSAEESV